MHTPAAVPRGGWLFCHPLGEEKLWAHRVLVHFARRLSDAGWTVLRIDCRGEGDSDRAFERTDVRTRLEDTRQALAVLRRALPTGVPIGLLGVRFGAVPASVVASESLGPDDLLVLWDPVVKGASYLQNLLMVNLASQLSVYKKVIEDRKSLVAKLHRRQAVSIEGYNLSYPLYEQVTAFDLCSPLTAFRGRCLVARIAPAGAPITKELAELLARCPTVQQVHAVEEPFWKEIKTFYQRAERLEEATLRWMEDAR